MPDLWITEVCAREDLRLPAWPDPNGVTEVDHAAAVAFRERRRDEPAPLGYEILGTGAELCKIRVGQKTRAATWYDQEHDVVFLVAYGTHESGAAADFYKWVPAAWADRSRWPTKRDYDALAFYRDQRWSADLENVGPGLVEEARSRAARSEPTDPVQIGDLEVQLLGVEIESEFYFAARFDPAGTKEYVDYARAEAMAMILARIAGQSVDGLELRPLARWRGEEVRYPTYAVELG